MPIKIFYACLQSMLRKMVFVVLAACMLSGCSMPASLPGSTKGGSIWKSFDGGQTFVPKVTVDEKRKITSADIISLAFHPTNPDTVYVGTLSSGIFKTVDGAERWEQIEFPPTKNYGLLVDKNNGDRIFASGVYENVSKLYRSEDAGKNWKEVYTEPGQGTVIIALAAHPDNADILYLGTSSGMLIKSVDSGNTWKNLSTLKGPVLQILPYRSQFDQPDRISVLIANQGVNTSLDGGTTWENQTTTSTSFGDKSKPDAINVVVFDPINQNIFYAGAKNGLFKSQDGGKSWTALNIIESSKKFPIRSVAINPANSLEIVYASGSAFYKSIDGGLKWSTRELGIDRGVSLIRYVPDQSGMFYFTLRKF